MQTRSDPFPPFAVPFRVIAAAASDVGKERSNNEDRVLVADLASGVAISGGAEATSSAWCGDWLAAVCDGMGGEAGGEIASAMTVDVVLSSMLEAPRTHDVLADALDLAVQRASLAVNAEAQRVPALSRMGTTATVAALGDAEIVIGQVGDSRAYLFRRGMLIQLTRDQTLAALIAERTRRDPDEVAANVVGANVILQAVGSRPHVDVALTRVPIIDGDTLLLCSDGLFGPVSDDVIRAILLACERPSEACTALVEAANVRGGPDNVSCIVARFARP